MKRHADGDGLSYDRIVCSYPFGRTLVVEHCDDGQWSERTIESASAPAAPDAQSMRPTHSTPRAAPTSPFLRLEEAAAYARCGKKRLLDWDRRGLIEPVRDPDDRRFYRRVDLDAVMALGPQPTPSKPASVKRLRANPRGDWELPLTYPKSEQRLAGGRPERGDQGEE